MSMFDPSTMVLEPEKDREEKAEAGESAGESPEEAHKHGELYDGESSEETKKIEELRGGTVKIRMLLKPEQLEWVKDQDFGLSEWVRNRIDCEMGKETGNKGERVEEGGSSPSGGENGAEREKDRSALPKQTCDACGRNPCVTEVTKDGEATKLCEECLQDKHDELSQEQRKNKQKSREEKAGSSENPKHLCERCKQEFGVEREAAEKVSLDGKGKRWLCEECLQELGLRQARRY